MSVFRSTFQGLTRVLPVVCLAIGLTSVASAQFRNTPFDPDTWRQTGRDIDRTRREAMDSSPMVGRNFTKIYFHNRTRETLRVAIMVLDYNDPRSSTLAVEGQGGWSARWYSLRPGQRLHVANSSNRFFYAYGESSTGVWGSHHRRRVGDRVVGMIQQDFGAQNQHSYTFSFNP